MKRLVGVKYGISKVQNSGRPENTYRQGGKDLSRVGDINNISGMRWVENSL